MTTPGPFPDVEASVMDLLVAWFGLNVGAETPADLEFVLPYVRVGLVAGRDDRVSDYSIVDIDVFTATRQQGYDLAEAIRDRLLDAPRATGLTPVIDRVRTETKPFPAPWENDNVHRRLAIYRISARR
jgi:hypothetical protein